MSEVKGGSRLPSSSSASTTNVQMQSPTGPAAVAGPPQPADTESFADFREWISQPVVAAFCGGGVAGAVSRTVVSPLERLKILLQVQSVGRDAYKLSVGSALGKMWKDEGWRGFMRGNGTNCIRIVPYSAVQFSSYNFYKRVSRIFLCPRCQIVPQLWTYLSTLKSDVWGTMRLTRIPPRTFLRPIPAKIWRR